MHIFRGRTKDGNIVFGDLRHVQYYDGRCYKIAHMICGNGFSSFQVEVDSESVGRSTELTNRDDVLLWAGDVVEYRGKRYSVEDDSWRFRLERNMVRDGENEDIQMDEDVAHECMIYNQEATDEGI